MEAIEDSGHVPTESSTIVDQTLGKMEETEESTNTEMPNEQKLTVEETENIKNIDFNEPITENNKND